MVGSENGGIYKCSLQSSIPSLDIHSTVTMETEFKSPIKFSFRPHYGPVYGISCSPFHRNLFLSCATDATTRLYSLLDVSIRIYLALRRVLFFYCHNVVVVVVLA